MSPVNCRRAQGPRPLSSRSSTIFGWLLLAVLVGSCGRTLAPGLEGEVCGSDEDCGEGLVCERRACLALDRLDAGDTPSHTGLFFAVLELERWDGPTGDQITELGRFISDLSTVLTPYYALWASTETAARFGRVDAATDPLDFAAGGTVTDVELDYSEGVYSAAQDVLYLPVVYSDPSVELDFDLPLRGGQILIGVSGDPAPGRTGSVELAGALRRADAQQLEIVRDDEAFTLYDVLQNEPLTVDTDGDGAADAWSLRWEGTALFE